MYTSFTQHLYANCVSNKTLMQLFIQEISEITIIGNPTSPLIGQIKQGNDIPLVPLKDFARKTVKSPGRLKYEHL